MSNSACQAERVKGGILGVALGDAFGALYEGGLLERALWGLIGKTGGKRRWTDDTQMTLDVLESLLEREGIDQEDLARRFASSYKWSRGYGPGAARTLRRIRRGQPWESAARSVYAGGSYGNGGAMRSLPIGLFFAKSGMGAVARAAEAAAAVTHAHALGREGAVQVSLAAMLTFQGLDQHQLLLRLAERTESKAFSQKLDAATRWLQSHKDVSAREVASTLGAGIAAVDSCITAIYVALRFSRSTFRCLIDFTVEMGGDVDTIAAMAGGIWGVARGIQDLPQEMLDQLEDYGRLLRTAADFAEAVEAREGQQADGAD